MSTGIRLRGEAAADEHGDDPDHDGDGVAQGEDDGVHGDQFIMPPPSPHGREEGEISDRVRRRIPKGRPALDPPGDETV